MVSTQLCPPPTAPSQSEEAGKEETKAWTRAWIPPVVLRGTMLHALGTGDALKSRILAFPNLEAKCWLMLWDFWLHEPHRLPPQISVSRLLSPSPQRISE